MTESLHLPVIDPSQAGEARRLASAWAEQGGCTKDHVGKVALVVSELARNLALHTRNGGCLLLRVLDARVDAIEVLSLDDGPGVANFEACLRDGYSTSGTAGTGLGAVQRASELFEFYSQPGIGTALLSHVCARASEGQEAYKAGVVNVPKPGQEVCGDSFAHRDMGNGRVRLMVADGLGHGPLAAEASGLAVKIFHSQAHLDLRNLLEAMHLALRATRGAAIAIAEIDQGSEQVLYAGVGNITGTVVNQQTSSHMVSANGTVGAVLPRIQIFNYGWTRDALLVMSSDGLKNHWKLDRYSGLLQKHPSLSAGVLFREFTRRTDDTTVAILRSCL